jgi:UDP-glucose:(heptosyl)LPS alpha-1,3-glucosyltransferase
MPQQITLVAHEVRESGGQERATLRLVEGLLLRGFPVTIIARRCDCPPHPALRFVRVPGPRWPSLLGFLWFFLIGGLTTAVRSRGLVHVVGSVVPNRADVVSAHFCHRAFERVRRAHGFRRASRSSALYRLHERAASLAFRLSEAFVYRPSKVQSLVAVSPGLAAELADCFPRLTDRIAVIENGVDPITFRSARREADGVRTGAPTRGERVALFVGGDWERKRLALAIEATARVPGWCLWVVGAGDRARYEATARACGADVWFTGPRDDPEDFYAAADAFVLPSAYEPFGMVVLEAAAAGLPVVLSPAVGIGARFSHGVDGFVVPPDAAQVAACFSQLGDVAVRRRIGEAARGLALEFDWSNAVDAFIRLYGLCATETDASAMTFERAAHGR